MNENTTKYDCVEFPLEIFPKDIQEIIKEVSEKTGSCTDYLGAGILSASSSAIGTSYKVRFNNTWDLFSNLYVAIVGRPGDSKSPALKFCFYPIEKKDDESYKDYLIKFQEHEENSEKDKSKQTKKIPIVQKYLINDFTPEALIQILYNNTNGVTVFVDELNGWIKGFDRYNSSGEQELYLSLWNGTTISKDRTSGKSIRVKNPFFSVIGSTQFSVIKEFGKKERSSNGFMDRILFAFPNKPILIKWNKNHIEKHHYDNYEVIINKLLNLKTETTKISQIDEEAKDFLIAWQNKRTDNHFNDFERSIEVKLQQYVIRFSLIIHHLKIACNEEENENISLQSIKNSIKLFEYFFSKATYIRVGNFGDNYLESLTELQKEIYKTLPPKFSLSEGADIATKNNRISKRQFQNYLLDNKLFKKIERGVYSKIIV